MIEYNSERNVYVIQFSDGSSVKGWVRELNGLVFVGLNSTYAPEWPSLLDDLLSDQNDGIRKELPVVILSGCRST